MTCRMSAVRSRSYLAGKPSVFKLTKVVPMTSRLIERVPLWSILPASIPIVIRTASSFSTSSARSWNHLRSKRPRKVTLKRLTACAPWRRCSGVWRERVRMAGVLPTRSCVRAIRSTKFPASSPSVTVAACAIEANPTRRTPMPSEAVLRERETLPRHLEEDQQQALRLLYDRRDRLVTDPKVNRVRALALRLEVPASSNLGTHRALERLRSALDQRPSLGYPTSRWPTSCGRSSTILLAFRMLWLNWRNGCALSLNASLRRCSDCAAVRSLLPRGSSATRGRSRLSQRRCVCDARGRCSAVMFKREVPIGESTTAGIVNSIAACT